MKKFAVLILTVIAASILAAVYGALHNQVTYSISEEYFTRFKYDQFGFEPAWFGGHRQTVAMIGVLSTWWAGCLAGLILGLSGLIHKNWQVMAKTTAKAMLAVLLTAIFFGISGFVYGVFNFNESHADLVFHEGVVDRRSFFIAGSIHNFSYLGAAIGLLAGTLYQIRERGWTERLRNYFQNTSIFRRFNKSGKNKRARKSAPKRTK
jgi:hypothetical protein